MHIYALNVFKTYILYNKFKTKNSLSPKERGIIKNALYNKINKFV